MGSHVVPWPEQEAWGQGDVALRLFTWKGLRTGHALSCPRAFAPAVSPRPPCSIHPSDLTSKESSPGKRFLNASDLVGSCFVFPEHPLVIFLGSPYSL